jgi:hypothetical protein
MGVGNDLRYSPTMCFETFPFPEPDEEQRVEISAAAKRLDELRRNWLNPEGASEAGAEEAHAHEPLQRPSDVACERSRPARRGGLRCLRLARGSHGRGGLEEPARAEPGAIREQQTGRMRTTDHFQSDVVGPNRLPDREGITYERCVSIVGDARYAR